MSYRLIDYPVHPELREEVLSVPLEPVKDGSGHDGHGYERGWIENLWNARLEWDDVMNHYPQTAQAVGALLARLEDWRVDQLMVNRMMPQSKLHEHRDGMTGRYRFHLPIVTDNHVYWWDEIIRRMDHFACGYWYGPVPFGGVMHAMFNDSDTERTHLIVDLEPPK